MLPWTTVIKPLLWYTRIYDNCGAPVAMLSMCVCVCVCVCVSFCRLLFIFHCKNVISFVSWSYNVLHAEIIFLSIIGK